MPRLFRVIAYSTRSSNGEASCSRTSVLNPHQVAHLGMSLLGPEFRRDHRAPFFCKCYFAAVVTFYLAIGDTMMFGILWYSSCGVEGLTEESCMVAEIMALLRVAWCPRSGPDLLNQFALEGWSRVFRVLGPTPDTLKRCGGASRGQPPSLVGHQPQNWKRGVSETSRAAAAPEFLLLGHQPQNWPPLDGMSLPSEKTSLTLLWNLHRGKVKGEREVEFLPACGAAHEKQSAAALPSLTPPALPTTGAIPRTGLSSCTGSGDQPEGHSHRRGRRFRRRESSDTAAWQRRSPGRSVGGSLHRARSALASRVLSRACSRSSLYPARSRKPTVAFPPRVPTPVLQ